VVSDADLAPEPPLDLGDRCEVVTGLELLGQVVPVEAATLAPTAFARSLVAAALRRAAKPAVWLDSECEVTGPIDLPDDATGLVVAAGPQTACDPGFLSLVGGDGGDALTWLHERRSPSAIGELPARFAGTTVLRDPPAWRRPADVQGPSEPQPAAGGLFDRVADGTMLTDLLRRLFAEAVASGDLTAPPFDAQGWAAFRAWLLSPSPDPAAAGISRYLHGVYLGRPDLRGAYPDLRASVDRDGFLGWALVHGVPEGEVPGWASPPAPPQLRDRPGPEQVALGVNVAGYFQSELGVGEAARRVVDALDAAQVPLLMVQGPTQPPSRRAHDAGSTSTEAAAFPLNLVCVNADGLPRFAREAGADFFAGRTTIGLWWWELPDFPEQYQEAFSHVDEVWVGTRHVQDALSRVSPVPVVRMPMPVLTPHPPRLSRSALGLPEGFLVLFAFDHNSVMERKNPAGLIEAFSRAFPVDSGASLVIKTINGDRHPAAHRQLLALGGDRTDIHVMDGYVSAERRDAMIASCDVYASLHRAEGFGLTLAEAMALGRPVVATNWSGNTDFMRPETSWLVPFAMTDVGPGNFPYDAAGRWADPDLDAAAAALSEIRADPDTAADRAAAGAVWIAEHHSAREVGAAMSARLQLLHPSALQRADAHAELELRALHDALDAARARIAVRPESLPATTRNPLAAAVRRLLLRATHAQAANQEAADEATLAATRQLADFATRAHQRQLADRRATAQLVATLLARQRAVERRLSE
jgi:glycosyltransferase involved in cell wall biosynthesis